MKYSICIDSLFREKDFLKSMKAVRDAGFDTIEFWSWWDKDIDAINNLRRELDMTISTFCTPFISLVDPSCLNDYLLNLKKTTEAAKKLDCRLLITQVGNNMNCVSDNTQKKNLIDGLKDCIPILEASGITLLVEPLNTLIDHKEYFLSDSATAFEIYDSVNSANIKILFDIYHQLVMGENVSEHISNNLNKIGHFHIAGYPGRHELASGDFDYSPLLKLISETGYDGFVGIEYMPLAESVAGLSELPLLK